MSTASTASFSSRLAQVKPSPSVAAKARVDALRAAGRDIIDFTIGEPDFPTPEHIVQAGARALAEGATRYTGSAGTPALRRAICAKLQRENRLDFQPGQVIVGTGAKQLIFNAFAATLNEDDEVVIPAPYWVSYPDMVLLNGGTPVIAPSSAATGFKLTPEALRQALTPRSRWLVLNTPNNPSGAIYTESELGALCEVLRGFPAVRVMTDEIYEHFAYGGARHLSPLNVAPDLADRTLVVNGVSKAYAMTGWRVGYAAGPLDLIRAMTLLASQTTTCASAVGQAAAVTALEGPQECVAQARDLFEQRRDRMVSGLATIPGVSCSSPDGAFYLFPSVQGLLGKTTPQGRLLAGDPDVAAYLLDAVGVASVDGSSYGMPGYLRLSFATSAAEIDRGCAAIAQAVAALR
ncbi:aminotransferase class I/II-fold pyridoxal phosphate-dependent enzyme [Xylophilus rhododendri]|uniref:Aminotransferase n=1 Tax=Xylophilus rhododendri TaxID=2697032 RepID=A0A857JCG0_9BURK|nr:pyridoxal phosphate-dependent aminotransferase [Xylophilus rhododendri]QHJ00429.1 aminotransferase class I/II-fold pyridoxal phosphate-dependent enzyme [Xylophilus rhododendri]